MILHIIWMWWDIDNWFISITLAVLSGNILEGLICRYMTEGHKFYKDV